MAQILCLSYWVNGIKANHRCPLGSHPCTAIAFSIDGSGLRIRGETRERYEPSWILVTQAKTVYWLEQEMAGRIMVLLVRGCGSERIKMGCYADDEELRWIARQLLPLVESGQASARLTIELLAGLAVAHLVKLHPDAGHAGIAARAQDIIDSDYQEPLSLMRLAARLQVNSDYLRRSFRRDIGESIARYILRRRMAAAQELLRGTAIPIKEVALLSGFSDQLYFSRQFHRMTGVAPSSWRLSGSTHEESIGQVPETP